MRLSEYLKDKIIIILLNIASELLLICFLSLMDNTVSTLIIIIIFWTVIFTLYLTIDYVRRRNYFNNLNNVLEKLDRRYLIAEVMKSSYKLEDKIYRNIIRKSNKSVIERINQIADEKKDYKEYIEAWVHDIKLPITAMELICENNKDEAARKIQAELAKVDNLIETVLFYAKADEVYKDYLIKETSLSQIINETISKSKAFFIQNKTIIEVECKADLVVSDKKWLEFIFSQILINAVKYKKNSICKINIYTTENDEEIRLYFEDDGIGIKESEIKRIFDKGFTGSNGRNNSKSTGIGLYLCKKLCLKLGLQVYAESKVNEYTKIIIAFPKNTYISKL